MLTAEKRFTVSQEQVEFYRTNGFVKIPGIISREEAAAFREAALKAAERQDKINRDCDIFRQLVNLWTYDETLRKLTLHPHVREAASALAGVPLRLWHDQLLIKWGQNGKPTEFHQDQPYWPHANSANPLSIWIALGDAPVENGCMSFIPKSHQEIRLARQELSDSRSLFSQCPSLEWEPRVTFPLKAGDCTFHHGRTAHMAGPNLSAIPRVGFVVIFMDKGTTYQPQKHVVTDPLNLKSGEELNGELFPVI